ncbi:hypothetical protein BJV77DRAFT_364705 [Russula vinacea]|nr:hypothetical protein BJV77DRAFT_364705 [Russula vinacea]
MFKPSSRPHLKMEHGERRLGCQLTDFPHDHPRRSGLHSRSHICRPHPRLSSPSFWRVACPHPCIRPCRSRSSSLSSSPSPSPLASASSPSTSCQHLHRSHLSYGPCVVTAAIVPLPLSPSPCRICRRRVVALIVVHAIIPILVIVLTSSSSRPHYHCPHSLAPFPAFCSPYGGVGFPLYAGLLAPRLMRVLRASSVNHGIGNFVKAKVLSPQCANSIYYLPQQPMLLWTCNPELYTLRKKSMGCLLILLVDVSGI